MVEPTSNPTEINTQSTQPSTSAAVREAPHKGNTMNAQNNVEKEVDTITISKVDYERLISHSNHLREALLRIDSLIHVEKGVLSQCLNQTVKAHNILADLEGIKDSIFTARQV